MAVMFTFQLLAASLCLSDTAHAEVHAAAIHSAAHSASHCQQAMGHHIMSAQKMAQYDNHLQPPANHDRSVVCNHCDGLDQAIVLSADMEMPEPGKIITAVVTTTPLELIGRQYFAWTQLPPPVLSHARPLFEQTRRLRI